MEIKNVFIVEKKNGINILRLKKELYEAIHEASVYPTTSHLHDEIGDVFKAFLLENKEEVVVIVPSELDFEPEEGKELMDEFFIYILGQLQREYQDARKTYFAIVFEKEESSYLKASFLATDCEFFQTLDEAIGYYEMKLY